MILFCIKIYSHNTKVMFLAIEIEKKKKIHAKLKSLE